jgi:hypothetical protein
MRVLGLIAVAWFAGVAHGHTAAPPAYPRDDGTCSNICFVRKSRAYQRCRAIPPRDRQARERCFRGADAALERCLAACSK